MELTKTRSRFSASTTSAIVLALACLAVLFWPPSDSSKRYWSRTTWHVTQAEMIPAEQARDEARGIIRQTTEMLEKGSLTLESMLKLDIRLLYIVRHAEQYGPHPRVGRIYFPNMDQGEMASIRLKLLSLPQYRNKTNWSKILDESPEWQKAWSFSVRDEESNSGQVTLRYFLRYLMTIPIAFLLFVALLTRERQSLARSVVEAFSYRGRLLFYPLTAPFYALIGFEYYSDYRDQVRQLVKMVGYATAASMSLVCGNAVAQTVKKSGDEKKPKGVSLQLDTRVIDPISFKPETLFNRTTFQGKNWTTQSISTFTAKTGDWYNETGGGLKVDFLKGSLWLDSYWINSSSGPNKITAGGQYFRMTPMMLIAIPAVRVELPREGTRTLFLYGNPFFRLAREGLRSRLAIIPDLQFKQIFGGPRSWSLGSGIGFFHRKGKNDRIELATLRNSAGSWQLRSRFIVNFAF